MIKHTAQKYRSKRENKIMNINARKFSSTCISASSSCGMIRKWPTHVFGFRNLVDKSFSRTPRTGGRPGPRTLSIRDNTNTETPQMYIHFPNRIRTAIPVFEQQKTLLALAHTATVISIWVFQLYANREEPTLRATIGISTPFLVLRLCNNITCIQWRTE